jgi:hypothetical protein
MQPETLLITGTRRLIDTWELQEWLCRQEYTTLLCGGAGGTDAGAAEMAREMGREVMEILPDYARHGAKAAPVLRNQQLVNEAARRGARVVAWQPDGPTNGTQDTLRRALAAGLPVEEYRGRGVWKMHEPVPVLAL